MVPNEGCSEEGINTLRDLKSSIIDEVYPDSETYLKEINYDEKVYLDIHISVCIRFQEPEESLRLMKSVYDRLGEVSENYTLSEVESNRAHNLGIYMLLFHYPYFASGLYEEAIDHYYSSMEYAQEAVEQNIITGYHLLLSELLFWKEYHLQTNDSREASNAMKFLESRVPGKMRYGQDEHNYNLAKLLLRIRLDNIFYLDFDHDKLIQELSVFYRTYLENQVGGQIHYDEFAKFFKESFQDEYTENELDRFIKDNREEFIFNLELSEDDIHYVFNAIDTLISDDVAFPLRDSIYMSLWHLAIPYFNKDPLLIRHYVPLVVTGNKELPLVLKEKVCRKLFEQNRSLEKHKANFLRDIEDYTINLSILNMRILCSSTSPMINSKIIEDFFSLSESFLSNFKEEIETAGMNIFNEISDLDDSKESLLIEMFEDITQFNFKAMMIIALQTDESYRKLIPRNAKLIEDLSKFNPNKIQVKNLDQLLASTMWGSAVDSLNIHDDINIIRSGQDMFVLHEDLFSDVGGYDEESLYMFIQSYYNFAFMKFVAFLFRDDAPNPLPLPFTGKDLEKHRIWVQKFKEFVEFNIEKTEYLLDLIVAKSKENRPLIERKLSKNGLYQIRDLLSLFITLDYFRQLVITMSDYKESRSYQDNDIGKDFEPTFYSQRDYDFLSIQTALLCSAAP